mmetsp:Transcript_20895/g.33957  ORF Transcript_20895/g.33957 Transcript_20895/m.33957 type:complete len:87 (+) Transcript_20895:134-394(+)
MLRNSLHPSINCVHQIQMEVSQSKFTSSIQSSLLDGKLLGKSLLKGKLLRKLIRDHMDGIFTRSPSRRLPELPIREPFPYPAVGIG